MLEVSGTQPPNLGRLMLAHAMPPPCRVMVNGLIYWCEQKPRQLEYA